MNKRTKVILLVLLIAFNFILILRTYNSIVEATGGAFPFTKHGGATGNGVVRKRVDTGATVTGYESYSAGECTHCHEPHASYTQGSVSEPYPSSVDYPSFMSASEGGGPDPYLLFADNNAKLCWTCHETFLFTGQLQGYGYYGFYQGRVKYAESGHYNNLNMKNPGYGGGSPWPRTDRSLTVTAGSCVNCHTPHGVKTASATYDTWAVPDLKQTTTGNPDVSTNYLIPRQLIAWEEALCERCHRSTGEGGIADAKDIRSQIGKLEGLYGTYGSGHPVHDVNQTGGSIGTFSGRHSLANEANPATNWNNYLNNKRHVECYDCHNPHVAKKGLSGSTLFRRSGESSTGRDVNIGPVKLLTDDNYGGANSGVWGVSVDISTGNVSGRLAGDEATYLYELCLKCHSAFADSTLTTQQGYSGPEAPSWTNRSRWDGLNYTYLGGDETMYLTDVAKDFSLNDPLGSPPKGYHPVFSLGRNRPPSSANPRWSVTTYSTRPTGVINLGYGFKNNFVPPWGPDSYVTCIDCHEDSSDTTPRGPHGSDRPFILRKLDASITYTVIDDGSGGSVVVNYSNFQYGYVSNTSYRTTVNLGTLDPNNLCLNCHRADVYGFLSQATGGNSCPLEHDDTDIAWPRYRYLSRQPHPVDEPGKGHSFCSPCAHTATGEPPRGIVCLRCHGGGSVGGIHGNLGNIYGHNNNNFDPGSGGPFAYDITNITPSSNRLLNGLAWDGLRFGTTSQSGGCFKGNEMVPFNFNGCTHSGGPDDFGRVAMYNY